RGMLLAGALEGEGSLRGMWLRGKKYWEKLVQRVGWLGVPKPPCLTTVWYALRRVDEQKLGEALAGWLGEEVWSVDGKTLRGSKRAGEGALQVLVLAAQRNGKVLAQRRVEGGDEVEAVLALLSEVPVEGKVVSMDAGLMRRPEVRRLRERGVLRGFGEGE
ncbi:MAG: hypothetical protein ACP5TV_04670, partial [Anaerolineae bacterium]